MIINLHITSWQGVSLGAEHYYAELQGPDETGYKKVELHDILTSRQAARLNKKNGERSLYRAGERHKCFDTEDDAIQAGIREWKTHFPDATYLVLGSSSYIEPKPLLASSLEDDSELKAKVQAIVDQCEAIGWHNNPRNDVKMDALYTEWAVLMSARIYT